MTRREKPTKKALQANVQIGNLPPFRPDAHCAKCDGADLSVAWVWNYSWSQNPGHWCDLWDDDLYEAREHLHRRCEDCGYIWCERPLDWAPLVPTSAPSTGETP